MISSHLIMEVKYDSKLFYSEGTPKKLPAPLVFAAPRWIRAATASLSRCQAWGKGWEVRPCQERLLALLGLGESLRLALGCQLHRPAEMLTRLDALERPTRQGTESRASLF